MAGLLKKDARHIHEGEILYNGKTKHSKAFSLPKVAHFVEQVMRSTVPPRLRPKHCGYVVGHGHQ